MITVRDEGGSSKLGMCQGSHYVISTDQSRIVKKINNTFKKIKYYGEGGMGGSGEHQYDPGDVVGEHFLVLVCKISKWLKKQDLSSDVLEYNAQIFPANLRKLLSTVVHENGFYSVKRHDHQVYCTVLVGISHALSKLFF